MRAGGAGSGAPALSESVAADADAVQSPARHDRPRRPARVRDIGCGRHGGAARDACRRLGRWRPLLAAAGARRPRPGHRPPHRHPDVPAAGHRRVRLRRGAERPPSALDAIRDLGPALGQVADDFLGDEVGRGKDRRTPPPTRVRSWSTDLDGGGVAQQGVRAWTYGAVRQWRTAAAICTPKRTEARR